MPRFAANIDDVPLARGFLEMSFHFFGQIDSLDLSVDGRIGENIAATAAVCLRLMPDRSISIIAEEHAAIVFGIRLIDGSEAPLDVIQEIRELAAVVSEPFMPLVARANQTVRFAIDTPLLLGIHGLAWRDRDASPAFESFAGHDVDPAIGR